MKEKCKLIVPPTFLSKMSGAYKCETNKRITRLTYNDGMIEEVETSKLPETDWENWFSIVGSVQSLRRE
jgi:hypothetical protein